MPAGSYILSFSDSASEPVWATEYWNGRAARDLADPLVVDPGDGGEITGIDAELDAAAAISGTILDEMGAPLSGVCADANVRDGSNLYWVGRGESAADGTYAISPLPATDVLVRFSDCSGGDTLVEQWYDGAASPDSATSLALSAGVETTGIDATMADGSTVTGHVSAPGGAPLGGIDVSFEPLGDGTWGWAQTDPAGDYTSSTLAPGDYRVQFRDNSGSPLWAAEYWNDQPTRATADPVTVSGTDPVLSGIDAVLSPAATVSGVVTSESATPVAGICVGALLDGYDEDPLGFAITGGDGSYQVQGLPPGQVRVVFVDCNIVGPYRTQWYDGVQDPAQARLLTLTEGATVTGVDARLSLAASISGRVTDDDGNPLGGICVQASTTKFVGGAEVTEADGTYTLLVNRSGDFRVQAVDCNPTPQFAGAWWGGGLEPSTAASIEIQSGTRRLGVDFQLRPGAPAGVHGSIENVRGEPMADACAVIFLPDRQVFFTATDASGNYDQSGVGSGTWSVGFIDCSAADDDGSPMITDPVTGVTYNGLWNGNAPLTVEGSSAPDPIAQGAELVTLAPGADRMIDGCFGCNAIAPTDRSQEGTSLTVGFETPGLVTTASAVETASSAISYVLRCDSEAGTVSSQGVSSTPVSTAGLAPATAYECEIVGSVDGLTVATSESFTVTTDASDSGDPGSTTTTTDPGGSGGSGSGESSSTSGGSAKLATTGAESFQLLLWALTSLLCGAIVVALGRLNSRRTDNS